MGLVLQSILKTDNHLGFAKIDTCSSESMSISGEKGIDKKKFKCTRLNMNYSRMMIRYLCLATVYTFHMFKASCDQ